MVDAIHVRLAVSACDRCPVAVLSRGTAVEDVRIDSASGRVEFVTDETPEEPPESLEFVEFGGRAHGRYDLAKPDNCAATDDDPMPTDDELARSEDGLATDDDRPMVVTDGGVTCESVQAPAEQDAADHSRCTDCSCRGLSEVFGGFPATPTDAVIDEGELIVSFVLSGYEELEAVVDQFEAAGMTVELRRLIVDRGGDGEDGDCPEAPPTADACTIDLAGVTDRQTEVARVAAERGYFEPDGASAVEIANELDLAKSTVSEHLRLVTADLFSQTFGDDAGT